MKVATDKITNLLKNDKDIEDVILYCLIHSERAREDIKKINEEDFYYLNNKELFNLLKNHIDSVKEFDIHILTSEIKSNKIFLSLFAQSTVVVLSLWKSYLGKLKDVSSRRKIQQIAHDMTVCVEENKNIGIIKKEILLKLDEVKTDGSGKKSKTSKEVIEEDFLPLLDGDNRGLIKTGFSDLDKQIRGFVPGRLYIVGGIPTVGKTTFILNLMQNICKQGKKVLFASLEMPYEDVATKMVSELSDEDMECVRDDKVEKKMANKATNNAGKIVGYDLHFIGKESVTVVDMENEISILGGVDIVFIDYLQKVIPINLRVSRYEQITQISKDIKDLARKFSIPVVTVASINRSFSRRDIKKPMLSDFRDSGNVEYDVDVALLLYRENQFEEVPKERENIIEIIFGKNRQGVGGHSIEMLFQPAESKFSQLEKGQYKKPERKDIYE